MNKPKLRLVELFSGIGFQRKGLEDAQVYDIESIATCDLDTNAVIGYAAIHCGLTPELVNTYENYPSREEMASHLSKLRIGFDFKNNKEYDWFKIARSKDSKNLLKNTWLACKLQNNLGDIEKVDNLPDCDMVTFSFPCQSLSQAGKQEGIVKGGSEGNGTRSGLVYEVLRLIEKMASENRAPKYLLMENVDALVSKKFIDDYNAINKEFEDLGYQVKYEVMNTKFTGIPQNRARVYGLYSLENIDNFIFPIKFDSGVRLEDILEDEVDDKYYISNPKAEELINELANKGLLE